MKINFKEIDNKKIIEMPEKVDISSLPLYKEDITEIVQNSTTDIILDMKNTKFMDSTGIGYIIMLMKILIKSNKKLFITNPNEEVKSSLESTRVLNFIEII